MAKEKETRERQPYRAREIARAERNASAYESMLELAKSLKWAASTQTVLADLVSGLRKIGKGLETLPEDFAPPQAARGWQPEEGLEVVLRDEVLPMYGEKKSPVYVIVAVNRTGDGPGARVYLRCECDAGVVVGPQAHFRAA